MSLFRVFIFQFICLLIISAPIQAFAQQNNIFENQLTKSEIDSLNQLAFSKFLSNPDSTKLIANQTLNYSKKINYPIGIGKALNYIGMSYHIKGDYDVAFDYYGQSLLVFEEIKDTINTAKILNNLALLSSDQEYYEIALDYNFRSMEIALESGIVDNIFNSYNNIGVTYEKLEDFGHALEFHQKALDLIMATENFLENKFYYYSTGNLGLINFKLKNYQEALEKTLIAYNYFAKVKDVYGISTAANHLGEIYLSLENYPEAEKFIKIALEEAEKISSISLVSDAMLTYGKFYFNQHQYNTAEKKFKELQTLTQANNFLKTEAETYSYLSKINSEKGQYLKALKNFEYRTILTDSLTKLKLKKQVAEQTIRYKLTTKEQEILLLNEEKLVQQLALKTKNSQRNFLIILFISSLTLLLFSIFYQIRLRKTNNKLKIQHQKISDQNRALTTARAKMKSMIDKEVKMLSIAAHELKTPLASMKLSANSIIRYWDKLDDTSKRNKLINIDKSINQVSIMVEDFLLTRKLESKQIRCKPKITNFNTLIQPIIEEVTEASDFSHKIEVINSEKDPLIYVDEVLSKNIFTNLLSNAIKYSPGAFKVVVETLATDAFFQIKIIDSGIGISKKDQENIFKPFQRGENVNDIKGTGIGLNIVQEFVEMHQGKIVVESTINEGTTFTLRFPTKPVK